MDAAPAAANCRCMTWPWIFEKSGVLNAERTTCSEFKLLAKEHKEAAVAIFVADQPDRQLVIAKTAHSCFLAKILRH